MKIFGFMIGAVMLFGICGLTIWIIQLSIYCNQWQNIDALVASKDNYSEYILDSDNISVTLPEENVTHISKGNGNRPEQNNDGLSSDDGGRMVANTAGGVASNRDRGYIRVYEERLAVKPDGDSKHSQRTRRESESERLVVRGEGNFW